MNQSPHDGPTVSVGLPVFNGERYLGQSLDSLLDQTFTDFEVVVCDNASTDATPTIVAERAARDPRVRYVRNPRNIGLARNFNRAFQLSRGEFFRWAMADDLVGPTNLADQVAALRAAPDAVLAVPAWDLIDADGDPVGDGLRPRVLCRWDGPVPQRLATLVDLVSGPGSIAVLPLLSGLVRAEALWATDQLGSYPMSDQVLLGQLAVQGPFVETGAPGTTRPPTLRIRLHAGSAGHGIGTGDYAAVHRTFFPDTVPHGLLRWRTSRYRRMWDVLARAGTTPAQRRTLHASYVRASARELLPV